MNIILTRKREHSRKPDEFYGMIEKCSPGPRLELFARHPRRSWVQWGDEIAVPAVSTGTNPTNGAAARELSRFECIELTEVDVIEPPVTQVGQRGFEYIEL